MQMSDESYEHSVAWGFQSSRDNLRELQKTVESLYLGFSHVVWLHTSDFQSVYKLGVKCRL